MSEFYRLKMRESADAFVVELGVDVVDEEEWIFASGGVKDGDIGELEKQKCASLLAGRTEFADVVAVEFELHIVAMRTNESVTRHYLSLDA